MGNIVLERGGEAEREQIEEKARERERKTERER